MSWPLHRPVSCCRTEWVAPKKSNPSDVGETVCQVRRLDQPSLACTAAEETIGALRTRTIDTGIATACVDYEPIVGQLVLYEACFLHEKPGNGMQDSESA